MSRFAAIEKLVSRIPPLWYLLIYLLAIPTYGLVYQLVAPHGFYAPYAKMEPGTEGDRVQLATTLTRALRRSIDGQLHTDLTQGTWRLDFASTTVDRVDATDQARATFRVRINAAGLNEAAGATQVAWTATVDVPEQPISENLGNPENIFIFRLPEVTFSKNSSLFAASNEDITKLLFAPKPNALGLSDPLLALNLQEDGQLRRYVDGVKGDPGNFSGTLSQLARMIYLSAVVITTLGLGDIVPITPIARACVAIEAVFGIGMAGLFLNALAYRASLRPSEPRQSGAEAQEALRVK